MLVDALVGWLVDAVGTAAVRTGARLVLGSRDERQLRGALADAVDAVVEAAPRDVQEPLVAALRERFSEPFEVFDSGTGSWQDGLSLGIRMQLEPLDNPELTPSGRSFLAELGVDAGWLSTTLADAVVRAIKHIAVTGGALAPLATQLNFDQVRDDLAELTGQAGTSNAAYPEAQLVRECDPIGLGVHRAIHVPRRSADTELWDELPEFVARAYDDVLRTRLDRVATDNQLIVLVGGSSTGKTRSAVEAVRDRLADWRLLHPLTGANLIALANQGEVGPYTVLWLNESQVYLDGDDGGAAAAVIRRLLASVRPLVAVGTLWPEYWLSYMRPPEFGAPDPHRQARQLLDTAIKIDVPDQFDDHDIKAARKAAARDPRLAAALAAHHGHGVTQVLAGGPALIDRWQHAHAPYGRAVISAAIDARRLGHFSAMPAELLQAAAVGYLTGPQLASAPPSWFDAAMTYAREPVKGAIAPLTATSQVAGQVDGYILADYLDQHGRIVRAATPVPGAAWAALAAHTRAPGDLNRLGSQAASRAQYTYARDLWAAACNHGDLSMAMPLRDLLDRAGHHSEAGQILRQAAAGGDPEGLALLAELLRRYGKSADLEQVLRQAAAAGHFEAAHELATLLHRAGRDRDAEQVLTKAIAAGDQHAWSLLTVLLDRQGRTEDAEQVLQQAAGTGYDAAVRALAGRLQHTGRNAEAENFLRLAAGTGLLAAVRDLTYLLRRTGREVEAEHVLREAGTRHTAALRMLADLLQQGGRTADAEHVLRQAAAAGDTGALRDLADIFRGIGRNDESEQALRQAAARGDVAARDRILTAAPPRGRDARSRDRTGKREHSRTTFHSASARDGKHTSTYQQQSTVTPARSGEESVRPLSRPQIEGTDDRRVVGGYRQGWLAASNWHRADTEHALRERAASGETDAARQLAVLLADTNRSNESERMLRNVVLAGDPNAISLLARILRRTGRPIEASLLSRYGLADDGTTASPW